MKNLFKGALLAAVVAFGFVGKDARAGDVMYPANFCAPVISDLSSVEQGVQFGVHNVSLFGATVRCPFNPPFFATIDHVFVEVYDRNPLTNVTCTLRGIDLAGTLLWSESEVSSGAGQASQTLGFRPGRIAHTVVMTCSIPGVFGGQFSHVTTYRQITTP